MNSVYEKLNQALQKFNSLSIGEQFDFQKLYLYSLVTHSTAIEGSTVTEIENTLMFDEDIVPGGRTVTEQLMNLDLKRAYDFVGKQIAEKPYITVEFLKKLSALVMRNTGSIYTTALGDFDSLAGDLRLLNVSAGRGGRSYPSYQKVPGRLAAFCSWLNEARSNSYEDAASVYAFSFEAHYRLVSIHPWVDGNGRTCRLLMNMLQMERGLLPSILLKEHKAGYIEALTKSQDEENSRIFVDFMMEEMTGFLWRSVEEFVKTS